MPPRTTCTKHWEVYYYADGSPYLRAVADYDGLNAAVTFTDENLWAEPDKPKPIDPQEWEEIMNH